MLKFCSLLDFLERSSEWDQVICFGAGKQLAVMQEVFSDGEIWDKIEYVIDNDVKKQGTRISIRNKEIEIISFDGLEQKIYGSIAILITCARYEELIKQLDSDIRYRDIDVYCLSHMQDLSREEEALQKDIPTNLRLNNKQLIPKVIHYCWFGEQPLPDKYKVWMESWHKYCPDYKIIEWNESNYDITKNVYMQQAYKCKMWGFVPDYARLDILYEHGGIYLDTDVELVQSIDELLYQKGFVGFESRDFVNFGSGFGTIKGLPIIKQMMDVYEDLRFINEDGSLNLTPSPRLQTEVLKKCGLSANGEYQIVESLAIYPEKLLNGKNLYTRRTILKPYTRSIHHFDGSWLDEKKKDAILQKEVEYKLCDSCANY